MKNKAIFYLRILFTIGLSYVLSGFFINDVFIADSPRLRPNLVAHLNTRFSSMFENTPLAGIFKPPASNTFKPLSEAEKNGLRDRLDTLMKSSNIMSVAQGVYAKDEETNTEYIIQQDGATWIEYTYIVNGKEIKLKVPLGVSPPTNERAAQMFK